MSTPAAPAVSVVIASYNMAKYLGQAIESVLAQQWQDLEVIVVDDGSTDDTAEVLARFAGDSRVRAIVQENQGQPRAKNAGVRACRGDYVAFCDADDYWLPHKLTAQLPLFEQNPRVGVVYSPITKLLVDGTMHAQAGRKFYRGDVLERMFLRNLVPFGTAVVRRECLVATNGFDESVPMGIDWALWLRIGVDWEFDFVPEPTYVYRIWPGQMSKNWRGRYECAIRIMDQFLEDHPQRIDPRIVARAYADTYTNLAASELRHDGMGACMATLRRALKWDPQFWPAWRLMLKMPLYRLRDAYAHRLPR